LFMIAIQGVSLWHSINIDIIPRFGSYPHFSSFYLSLFFTNWKKSIFMLIFLTHFELIFVQGETHGSSFSFLHGDIQVFQVCWRGCHCFHHMFWVLCQQSDGHAGKVAQVVKHHAALIAMALLIVWSQIL
jgi:hypothetical protein